MKNILKQISDLCNKASEEVFENDQTREILNTCDKLQYLIDDYFNINE